MWQQTGTAACAPGHVGTPHHAVHALEFGVLGREDFIQLYLKAQCTLYKLTIVKARIPYLLPTGRQVYAKSPQTP
eukprot:1267646-Prymnesium_polylepis.2